MLGGVWWLELKNPVNFFFIVKHIMQKLFYKYPMNFRNFIIIVTGSTGDYIIIVTGSTGDYIIFVLFVCYSHRSPVTLLFLSCLYVCLSGDFLSIGTSCSTCIWHSH